MQGRTAIASMFRVAIPLAELKHTLYAPPLWYVPKAAGEACSGDQK